MLVFTLKYSSNFCCRCSILLQPSTKIVRQTRQTPPSPLVNVEWLFPEAGILFWIDLPFPTLKKVEGGACLNHWVFLRKLWLSHYILFMVVWILRNKIANIFGLVHYFFFIGVIIIVTKWYSCGHVIFVKNMCYP